MSIITTSAVRLVLVDVAGYEPFPLTTEQADTAAHVLAQAIAQDTPTGPVWDQFPDVVTYRLGDAFAAAWRDYDGRVHLAPNGRTELVLDDVQAAEVLAALVPTVDLMLCPRCGCALNTCVPGGCGHPCCCPGSVAASMAGAR